MNWKVDPLKKDAWNDVFCPRCGEPLGIKNEPEVHSLQHVRCYNCAGLVTISRQLPNKYVLTYQSTEYGGKNVQG